jgi:anhydro-N-acetylmuramic acid kinase
VSELYLGLISGTSLDGVDAALVAFEDGRPRLSASLSLPYPDELLRDVKRAANPGESFTADHFGALDARLGDHFARAALDLIDQAKAQPDKVVAIGSHGQTVAHDADAPHPYSLQLGDPSRIAEGTGIDTVADFRRRDLAAGGQGAPLMPGFHETAFRRDGRDTAVLNLGGIANLTLLPGDPKGPTVGFDTGPANCFLDLWARRCLGRNYDDDGALARSGKPDGDLLATMLSDGFFHRPPPKSTGTQHFSEAWLDRALGRRQRKHEDVAATLTELTAVTVRDALAAAAFHPTDLLCCGGGAHNRFLLERLAAYLPDTTVASTEVAGIPPDWVEAMGFGWLARETLAGRPGNRCTVTGATGPRVLGALYPGGCR